jgi:hypothetical protein
MYRNLSRIFPAMTGNGTYKYVNSKILSFSDNKENLSSERCGELAPPSPAAAVSSASWPVATSAISAPTGFSCTQVKYGYCK